MNGMSCVCVCEEDMLREQESRVVQNINNIASNITILHLPCLVQDDARYILLKHTNMKK